MTAVVGILNMSAVAIAADSAVTVTNQSNEKIFNNANKIFQLSKYHPVGLAIYGSGSLMFTPWEVIVKLYRNQLNDTAFGTVNEYAQNFLDFLQQNNYFSTALGFQSKIAATIQSILDNAFGLVQQLVIAPNPQGFSALSNSEQILRLTNTLKQQLSTAAANLLAYSRHNGNFGDFSKDDVLNDIKQSGVYSQVINEHNITRMGWLDAEVLSILDNYIYNYLLTTDFSQSLATGLVFVGYGELQLYPQCHCVEIAEVIFGRLRWKNVSDDVISDHTQSAIRPFAQADVINTIISGLSPDINNQLLLQLRQLLNTHNQRVAGLIHSVSPEIALQLQNGFNINNLISDLGSHLGAYQNNFSVGLTLETVRLFSKEDLAELAESLIYLTYLKRRMTFAQETVSKPVDVAVISKGDGFVWIKRKFYFDSSLNPHFLRNHFRN